MIDDTYHSCIWESPVTRQSSEECFRQLFRDWTTRKGPRPSPAAAAPDLNAKGVKAGVWTEDLSSNPKKRKAGGNKGRESEARKQARKKGVTAVMTMAINKKAGLTIIWRDVTVTGSLDKSDCVKLTPDYTLRKATCTPSGPKKPAAAGDAGDAGLGPRIDINDLPTEALEPKLLVDEIVQQGKALLGLADEVRAGDMSEGTI
ncbi:hypothetical protein BHE90_013477 [Fusarium euwallaceae]|uniref:Uncharacterized protein n=1 Tax=Fusarium euwallaceae TaxID=1147111 RepID=A0A430L8R9_9HYPO|nr:hypothetical protein BHE90_013477 [Fusarium euwallaceae]